MKIIITGPNGYIARNLIKSIDNKKNIILLGRKKKLSNKSKVINFDLRKKIIPELSCDIFIHSAAITPQKKYSNKDFNETNFLSLKNILKKVKIKKKLIFFSTTDVYKNQNNLVSAREDFKINYKKISNYAKSKYNCEILLKSLNKDKYPFQKIIFRLPGIVGKGNHKNFITNLIENLIIKKISINFNETDLFNNIYHIDDLIKLIKIFLKNRILKNFLIINVGTKKPIMIRKIIKIFNRKIKLRNSNILQRDTFTINVTKLNKYYKRNQNTEFVIKKYLKEKLHYKL